MEDKENIQPTGPIDTFYEINVRGSFDDKAFAALMRVSGTFAHERRDKSEIDNELEFNTPAIEYNGASFIRPMVALFTEQTDIAFKRFEEIYAIMRNYNVDNYILELWTREYKHYSIPMKGEWIARLCIKRITHTTQSNGLLEKF